jgi:hypothetical protein
MKIISILTVLFLSNFLIGQKSYYFADVVAPDGQEVNTVQPKYFGTYTSESGLVYEVNANGIFIISTNISSISREVIRESSQYQVRGDYLFGVVENDSVPCALQGEYYYFGVRNKTAVTGSSSINVLVQSSDKNNVYYINRPSQDAFVPMRLTFSKNAMDVELFDYELDTEFFNFIEEQSSLAGEFNELIILSPTASEFDELERQKIFAEKTRFTKSK